MTTLVIAAVLASIGVTALLTVVLGRLNVPGEDRKKRDGDGAGAAPVSADGERREADSISDNGGSDGGGDGGGD